MDKKLQLFLIGMAVVLWISSSCSVNTDRPVEPSPIAPSRTASVENVPAIATESSSETSPLSTPHSTPPNSILNPIPTEASHRESMNSVTLQETVQDNKKSKDNPKIKDQPHGTIHDDDLEELSGMIVTSQTGEFWGHNDQGNKSKLFRLNRQGKILQKITLTGIQNDDWEAITRDQKGNLYIGGFGDNEEKRTEYHIYQCPEPNRNVKKWDRAKSYPFRYADGKSHNCEAFFYLDGKLVLITKEKNAKENPTLFCIDTLEGDLPITARELGALDIRGVVTDAAISNDMNLLAVLTNSGLAFYRVSSMEDLLSKPIQTVRLDFDQCEGLCFDGKSLVISNESGDMWIYPVSFFF